MSPYIVGAILAMAAVTLLCRATPFLFFMRRRPPAILDFLQVYIPPMIMTVLVLGSYKAVDFAKAPYGIPAIVSGLVVAGLHLWKRNSLVSILGGTALYMLLIRVM
ncbi:MAG: AzlD domain-containing protein [Rectinemataceae bacterium]|jgi:branched-subunit amino acid transport protein AzlD